MSTDLSAKFNLTRNTPSSAEKAEPRREDAVEPEPPATRPEPAVDEIDRARSAEPGTAASEAFDDPERPAAPGETPSAAGRAPRRRSRPAAAPAANPRPAGTPTDPSVARSGDKAPSAPRAGARPQIMVALPVDIGSSFKARAAAERMSYAQLVLLAVEETYEDELPAEFAKRSGGRRGLFSTSYAPRLDNGPRVKLNLHLLASDLDVIDDLWNRCEGCQNRNDYLSTAVEIYLAKSDQT